MMLPLLVVLLGLGLCVVRAAKSGSSAKRSGSGPVSDNKAALPRSKGKSRGKKGPSVATLTQRLSGGLMYRMFREMKTAFGSELEALTLQLTRPADSAVPESALEELHQCFEAEADNAQLTVSLLAKLSRKLVEPSVYSKLKALLCLHRLTESSSEAAQNALLQCVRSLRSEVPLRPTNFRSRQPPSSVLNATYSSPLPFPLPPPPFSLLPPRWTPRWGCPSSPRTVLPPPRWATWARPAPRACCSPT